MRQCICVSLERRVEEEGGEEAERWIARGRRAERARISVKTQATTDPSCTAGQVHRRPFCVFVYFLRLRPAPLPPPTPSVPAGSQSCEAEWDGVSDCSAPRPTRLCGMLTWSTVSGIAFLPAAAASSAAMRLQVPSGQPVHELTLG